MKMGNKRMLIRQLDRKINPFRAVESMPPGNGWIQAVRTTLNMSFSQLGKRMGISPSAVQGMEKREKSGGITLNSLREVAEAMEMRLVYGFVSKDESLEKMVERKAREAATRIVQRTSISMELEDQENSGERLREAVRELTDEITKEVPKYLWD
jgi:predicted DNA-binding mobile mystery protein A